MIQHKSKDQAESAEIKLEVTTNDHISEYSGALIPLNWCDHLIIHHQIEMNTLSVSLHSSTLCSDIKRIFVRL